MDVFLVPAAGNARRAVVQTVHRGAVHFVEAVIGGPEADEARRALYSSKRRSYKVIVSQIILGEILAVILGKYGSYGEHESGPVRLLRAIYDSGVDIRSGLVTPGPWKPRGIIDDLTELDPVLRRTDLIVLAIALADPDSARLFTKDSVLLENRKIADYERKMREGGLRNVCLKITHTL